MKAAVLSTYNSPFVIKDIPRPSPKRGEVLIQVKACGICGSDHFLQTGGFNSTLPIIPGHEASGCVVGLGDEVSGIQIGDRVAIYYIIHCGHCRYCIQGYYNLCQKVKRIGVDVHGACAEFISVPKENVIPIPNEISYVQAAVITDAVATPYHALKLAKIRSNDVVLILGIGGIGSNAIQLAKAMGGTVIAASRSDIKLNLARKMGADFVFHLNDSLLEHIRQITDGYMADVVLQCSPSAEMDRLGFQCLGSHGKMILIAANQETFSLRSVDFIWGEKQIVGSRGFTKEDIVECLELFQSGKIEINHLTEKTLHLEEINQAMSNLDDPHIVRTVILPSRHFGFS